MSKTPDTKTNRNRSPWRSISALLLVLLMSVSLALSLVIADNRHNTIQYTPFTSANRGLSAHTQPYHGKDHAERLQSRSAPIINWIEDYLKENGECPIVLPSDQAKELLRVDTCGVYRRGLDPSHFALIFGDDTNTNGYYCMYQSYRGGDWQIWQHVRD